MIQSNLSFVCGGQLNERDRLIGRLLLERGFATREVLQRVAAATQERRQRTGQEVELLVVMVDMGVLARPLAGQIWEEAAALAQAPTAPPPTAPLRNPPLSTVTRLPEPDPGTGSFKVAGSASSAAFKALRPEPFDPTGELSTMDAPPAGDVLGFSAPNAGLSPTAPTVMGNFDVAGARAASEPAALGGDFESSRFDPPGGFGPPPTFDGPPSAGAFNPTGGFAPPPSGFAPSPPPRGNVGSGLGLPAGGDGYGGYGAPKPRPSVFDSVTPGKLITPPPGALVPGGGVTGGLAPGGASWGSDHFTGQPQAGSGFNSKAAGGFQAAPADVFSPDSRDAMGRPPSWDESASPSARPPSAPGFDAQVGGGFQAAPASVFSPDSRDAMGRAPSWNAPAPTAEAVKPKIELPAAGSAKKKGPRRTLASNRLSVAQRRASKAGGGGGGGGGKTLIFVALGIALLGGASLGGYALFANKGTTSGGGEAGGGETGGGERPPQPPPRQPPPVEPTDPGSDLDLPERPTKPLTKGQIEDRGELLGDQLLARASDLAYEQERYDEAVGLLERYPDWLRGASIHKVVEEKIAEYSRYAGFRRQLEEALEKGRDSTQLKKQIMKIEGGGIGEDLGQLPCVKRFKTDARGLLGDSGYDKLALEAAKLEELDDMNGPGLED